MNPHPDGAALEAYVLGHHDEIDPTSVERHLEGCDDCMGEVAREARLELLLAAAGAEDAFAVAPAPLARRRWPLVAAATVAGAVAVTAVALWRPTRGSERLDVTRVDVTERTVHSSAPSWAVGLEPGEVRCEERADGLSCAAAADGLERDQTAATAGDAAVEALVDEALARGSHAVKAQHGLYRVARNTALARADKERVARVRRTIARRAPLGKRESWYWEEYSALDGPGTEFIVYVRFVATASEIAGLLEPFRPTTLAGAELVRAVPTVHWSVDVGDRIAFFVLRPATLGKFGIRAGDVLLMDQRRNANRVRVLIATDEILVWRAGLEQPVLPSKLPKKVDVEQK